MCGVFELKRLIALIMPAEAGFGVDVADKAIKVFVDNLPQARIYAYDGGEGETRMNAVPSLFRRRRYGVSCPAGGECAGKGKGE